MKRAYGRGEGEPYEAHHIQSERSDTGNGSAKGWNQTVLNVVAGGRYAEVGMALCPDLPSHRVDFRLSIRTSQLFTLLAGEDEKHSSRDPHCR
jgi:hypothetical protein